MSRNLVILPTGLCDRLAKAAPLAAGEAALSRSLSQKANAKDRIRTETLKIDRRNPGLKIGQGRIDLKLALEKK